MEVSVNSTSCVTLPACTGNEQNLTECFNGGPVTSSSSTNHIAGFTCGNNITYNYTTHASLYIMYEESCIFIQVVSMVMFDSETNHLKWMTQ